MRQILQNLKNGDVQLTEVPVPQCGTGQVVIKTHRTLVSLGTEKMLLQFGRSGWIGKAQSQPEKVKQVLQKIKTDGLKPTLDAVRNKLDQPMPLGYCQMGTVVDVGPAVRCLRVGDRVISNGPHAEFVCVPEALCAKVPDAVGDDTAAFTVISAIGLQGVRLAQPTLGETFVVMGLGLIGLLTVQILRAHGCEVIGFDFDAKKLKLAESFGAKVFALAEGSDPVAQVLALTHETGADGVLITASTDSNQPIDSAAKMTRQRGRIVLVGVAGLKLSRDEFFKKEISFQVSCSYGPGRYDFNYEQRGLDYPVGFVRWTEQRNFSACLAMMERGALKVDALISERVPLENAPKLYSDLGERKDVLGILLEYPHTPAKQHTVRTSLRMLPSKAGQAVVGVIGAGQFAQSTLLPALQKCGATLHTIVGRQGVGPQHMAKKFAFAHASTDMHAMLANPEINTVVISTQHNTHAAMVCQALRLGKNVFVEKPLALTLQQVSEIENLMSANGPKLMVGFNRRFSPLTLRLKSALDLYPGMKSMVMTVNAGAIAKDHWTQDPERGGGRLVGEGCHFVDLLRYLAGHPIVEAHLTPAQSECGDTFTASLRFADGSIGTIHYFANGNKGFPKETLQVFSANNIYVIDNFKSLKISGAASRFAKSLWSQDKGHASLVKRFIGAVEENAASPIASSEILEVSRWTLRLAGHRELEKDQEHVADATSGL